MNHAANRNPIRTNGTQGVTPVEHLAAKERLIRKMAAEHVPPGLREDAEQEARLAVWRVAKAHADDHHPLGPLLTVVARRAVLAIARGRPMTGEAGVRGRTRDPLRCRTATTLHPHTRHAGIGDHTENTALRLDIARALARLTPWQRAYVAGRYLHDRPVAELAGALRMSETGLLNAWARRIRPVLASALSTWADSDEY